VTKLNQIPGNTDGEDKRWRNNIVNTKNKVLGQLTPNHRTNPSVESVGAFEILPNRARANLELTFNNEPLLNITTHLKPELGAIGLNAGGEMCTGDRHAYNHHRAASFLIILIHVITILIIVTHVVTIMFIGFIDAPGTRDLILEAPDGFIPYLRTRPGTFI